MKTNIFLLLVLALGSSMSPAAAPPNDLYANRIVLSGNSLCFTSSVVGATREMNEVIDPEWVFSGSIWWSWTAAQSLPVTVVVERLNVIPGPLDTTTRDAFVAWLPPSSETFFPTNYCCSSYLIGELPLRKLNPTASMTFTSTPGATYQFEQTGNSINDFRVRIIATNLPLILEQPKSGTVAAGRSALFWVLAAGGGPFGYQWRFNETHLPGENAPMLALTNVTLDRAGNYSVVVSNFGGTVVSDTAGLIVNDGVASPRTSGPGRPIMRQLIHQAQRT